jgi:chaperonin GroES
MNLKPLADRVIVEPIEYEEKTPSGIILPETAKEKPQEGQVIAVGLGRWDEEGKKRVPLEVKVGDRVIFAKYSGTEFKQRVNGTEKKYLILSERDILAVVEK